MSQILNRVKARFQGTEAPTRINMEAQRLADEILAVFDEGAGGPGEGA